MTISHYLIAAAAGALTLTPAFAQLPGAGQAVGQGLGAQAGAAAGTDGIGTTVRDEARMGRMAVEKAAEPAKAHADANAGLTSETTTAATVHKGHKAKADAAVTGKGSADVSTDNGSEIPASNATATPVR